MKTFHKNEQPIYCQYEISTKSIRRQMNYDEFIAYLSKIYLPHTFIGKGNMYDFKSNDYINGFLLHQNLTQKDTSPFYDKDTAYIECLNGYYRILSLTDLLLTSGFVYEVVTVPNKRPTRWFNLKSQAGSKPGRCGFYRKPKKSGSRLESSRFSEDIKVAKVKSSKKYYDSGWGDDFPRARKTKGWKSTKNKYQWEKKVKEKQIKGAYN